jgi:hypothetical protein
MKNTMYLFRVFVRHFLIMGIFAYVLNRWSMTTFWITLFGAIILSSLKYYRNTQKSIKQV